MIPSLHGSATPSTAGAQSAARPLPVVGDAVTLFDVMVLIIVAMLLVVKIRGSVGSLDTTELDALLEKR